MRLVLFDDCVPGVLLGDTGDKQVADLSAASVAEGGPPLRGMRSFLELPDWRGLAARAVAHPALRVRAARLDAPIRDPEKVVCVGMNYEDHCLEQGLPLPEEPVLFNKFASSISAPGAPIPLTPDVAKLDFEVELAVVIGRECRNVAREDALACVAGVTVAHDVSARDWQLERNGGQWMIGKAMDGYLPLGPAIVSLDELGDVHDLRLRCVVNGEVMQDSSTNQLVHGVDACVAWASRFFTLRPGDVILTGTPPGVGCFRDPPVFLRDGDVCTVEIEHIGAVTNRVEAVPLRARL